MVHLRSGGDHTQRKLFPFAQLAEPSLGLLIANGFQYLMSGKYWISFFPGVALLIVIVAINLVADQLRDVLNPRLQTQ